MKQKNAKICKLWFHSYERFTPNNKHAFLVYNVIIEFDILTTLGKRGIGVQLKLKRYNYIINNLYYQNHHTKPNFGHNPLFDFQLN